MRARYGLGFIRKGALHRLIRAPLELTQELHRRLDALFRFGQLVTRECERREADRGVVAGQDAVVDPAVGLTEAEDVPETLANILVARVDLWIQEHARHHEPSDSGEVGAFVSHAPPASVVLLGTEILDCALGDGAGAVFEFLLGVRGHSEYRGQNDRCELLHCDTSTSGIPGGGP